MILCQQDMCTQQLHQWQMPTPELRICCHLDHSMRLIQVVKVAVCMHANAYVKYTINMSTIQQWTRVSTDGLLMSCMPGTLKILLFLPGKSPVLCLRHTVANSDAVLCTSLQMPHKKETNLKLHVQYLPRHAHIAYSIGVDSRSISCNLRTTTGRL